MSERPVSAQKKFVETALVLFAERGYFGVSLADVAGELALTKQSVLYHFKTKDALYGAVIDDIAKRLDVILEDVMAVTGSPRQRVQAYLARMYAHMQTQPRDARLITRELLDNLDRTETGQRWYLKRFLDVSVALISALPTWQGEPEDRVRAAAYQLIGAVCYFVISDATLAAIWGRKAVDGMDTDFLAALYRQAGLDGE